LVVSKWLKGLPYFAKDTWSQIEGNPKIRSSRSQTKSQTFKILPDNLNFVRTLEGMVIRIWVPYSASPCTLMVMPKMATFFNTYPTQEALLCTFLVSNKPIKDCSFRCELKEHPCKNIVKWGLATLYGLEWISSHQCTSWGWARSARFADEHPPCPRCFFFPPLLCPTYLPLLSPLLPPPSYPKPTSPLLPTTYLPPPTLNLPPPLTPSPELELWSWCSGAMELWMFRARQQDPNHLALGCS
jgi:hypothetical protein